MGEVVEWRCPECGRLHGKALIPEGIVRIKCWHHECKSMATYFIRPPGLVVNGRTLVMGSAMATVN